MNTVNIGLSETKIAQLINEGHLCAADIQCLDKSSKKIIWQLCLWCCQKRIYCKQVACHQDEHQQSQATLSPVY
ncbi:MULTISPECIES: hypothetical protein [Shewanella]|jgi:hypothetical protein|uniref:Uncharacterized protein n=1 Tax=Shewanella holmiensis TaxID=2952222 RepID=A0A9X2WM39_9GAMM|nr:MULTISPECIES: hypothetical protein [Shewanella]MCT7941790.1 hypothetical protein [Shewanella holmiensis]MDP5146532.1 hypothetical protein [Shewanella sp. ULN5]